MPTPKARWAFWVRSKSSWSGDSNFMTVTGRTRLVPEELDVTFSKLQPHFRKIRKDLIDRNA